MIRIRALFIFTAFIAALIFMVVDQANAQCSCCGCKTRCRKVCRLVCEEKEVEVTCWGCQCEDFCLPCPSQKCCKHCGMVCGKCDGGCVDGGACGCSKGPCAVPKKFVWYNWKPCGATMYTRKKLMKKTVTKKVPHYKWVVEYLCPSCDAKTDGAEILPGAAIPPVPDETAALKYTVKPAAIEQPTTEDAR